MTATNSRPTSSASTSSTPSVFVEHRLDQGREGEVRARAASAARGPAPNAPSSTWTRLVDPGRRSVDSPIGRRRRMSRAAARRTSGNLPVDTIPGPCPRPVSPGLFASAYRTHTCGELRASDAGSEVRLSGWVNRRRDQGGLIFLDLRDRQGITQVVIDRTDSPGAHETGSQVRTEFVLTVVGTVAKRLPGTENTRLADRRDRGPGDRRRDPQRVEDPAVLRQRARRPGRRVAPAQVPLSRPAPRAHREPPRPPEPARARDPRRPPAGRVHRGRDPRPREGDARGRPRLPRARAASGPARSTRCPRARSSSSSS